MDSKMVDVLVCPICKGKLRYDRQAQELICNVDSLAYPIKEGIPLMLTDKARRLDEQSK